MRISGGDARGIRLKVPRNTRPASELVRQAVFSSLAAHVPGARLLDLFCGSGAYALEGLSRGADEAVLVDADAEAVRTAKSNAQATGLADRCTFRRRDVRRYLQQGAADDGPFDVVFADPPYDDTAVGRWLLGELATVVATGGRVVYEARRDADAPVLSDPYLLEAERHYGDTRLLVYLRRGSEEEA